MSIIEKKVEKMADIVSGNDLVGMWNAFIEKDDEMQKLKERIGADFYDKFFHIRDNVVEQIGEICGNDYKKFVSEILDDYENSGYAHWQVDDDWLVYEGGGRWHTEPYADNMIGHILESETLEEFGNLEITAEEIADRFIKYLEENID